MTIKISNIMSSIKIAMIQSALHWENKEENLKMFEEKIFSFKNEVDLILHLTQLYVYQLNHMVYHHD
mgnify:CR=1 FL=1